MYMYVCVCDRKVIEEKAVTGIISHSSQGCVFAAMRSGVNPKLLVQYMYMSVLQESSIT